MRNLTAVSLFALSSVSLVPALATAAPGHVEEVRGRLLDALTPEQITQLRAISEAVLEHNGERVTAPV